MTIEDLQDFVVIFWEDLVNPEPLFFFFLFLCLTLAFPFSIFLFYFFGSRLILLFLIWEWIDIKFLSFLKCWRTRTTLNSLEKKRTIIQLHSRSFSSQLHTSPLSHRWPHTWHLEKVSISSAIHLLPLCKILVTYRPWQCGFPIFGQFFISRLKSISF